MLPIRHRLIKREDFALIYKNGSYAACDGISMKLLKTNQDFTRIGFPISKKHLKKAVDRNLTRRILREAARVNLSALKPGYDLVLMISPEKKALQFSETVIVLKKLFTKANLFI
ncbi:MAG: ribonuclease P protein component [Candidatus Moraniibacteriota bacterium]